VAQRLTDAREIFWANLNVGGSTFFATYRYHANAGAFLNLVLPFVFLWLLLAFRHRSEIGKAFWALAVVVVAASTFINLSRASIVIAAGLILALGVWQVIEWLKRQRTISAGPVLLSVGLGLAVIAGMAWSLGLDATLNRWSEAGDLMKNQRYVVYNTVWNGVLPVSGWWGFGPGTFSLVFPFFTYDVAHEIPGVWNQAHQDYLQTLVEWGWFGGGLWLILIGVGLLRAAWLLLARRGEIGDGGLFLVAALLSLAGVLVHAAVDFPLQIASLRLYATCALGFCWGISLAEPGRHLLRRRPMV
jgi:O-antigen ligase